MTQRDKEIEARAREYFTRDNQDPDLQWPAEFAARGSNTKVAIGEGLRQELLQKAEQALIAEGRISPKPL